MEEKRSFFNALSPPISNHPWMITFVQEGATVIRSNSTPSERGQLCLARDWKLLVDIGQQLVFPTEIPSTTVRPDMVLWSPSLRKGYIIELTVPWEDSMDEAYERKYLHYAELAAEAQHRGWTMEVRPVEVGCGVFVATSTVKLLRDMGIRGHSQRAAINEPEEHY